MNGPMFWHSAADFWAMGGYGLYVWGSFAVTAGVMVIEVLMVKARKRALLREMGEMGAEEG